MAPQDAISPCACAMAATSPAAVPAVLPQALSTLYVTLAGCPFDPFLLSRPMNISGTECQVAACSSLGRAGQAAWAAGSRVLCCAATLLCCAPGLPRPLPPALHRAAPMGCPSAATGAAAAAAGGRAGLLLLPALQREAAGAQAERCMRGAGLHL